MWNSAVGQERDREFSCFMVDAEKDTAVAEESLRNVAIPHPWEIQSQYQLSNQKPLPQERFLWNPAL